MSMASDPHAERRVSDLQDRRDRNVVSRIAQGEQDAVADLLRTYGPACLGLGKRIIGDQGLAEEVVQEVFLSVWRRADAFDEARGSVRSWLLTQVHHRAVDVVRREAAHRRRDTMNGEPLDRATGPEDVVEEAWLATRRREVQQAIALLPDEQRAVLMLAYFDGLSQTQVASKLGVPLGTVKSRTLAGMRRMRERLRSIEGGET